MRPGTCPMASIMGLAGVKPDAGTTASAPSTASVPAGSSFMKGKSLVSGWHRTATWNKKPSSFAWLDFDDLMMIYDENVLQPIRCMKILIGGDQREPGLSFSKEWLEAVWWPPDGRKKLLPSFFDARLELMRQRRRGACFWVNLHGPNEKNPMKPRVKSMEILMISRKFIVGCLMAPTKYLKPHGKQVAEGIESWIPPNDSRFFS